MDDRKEVRKKEKKEKGLAQRFVTQVRYFRDESRISELSVSRRFFFQKYMERRHCLLYLGCLSLTDESVWTSTSAIRSFTCFLQRPPSIPDGCRPSELRKCFTIILSYHGKPLSLHIQKFESVDQFSSLLHHVTVATHQTLNHMHDQLFIFEVTFLSFRTLSLSPRRGLHATL